MNAYVNTKDYFYKYFEMSIILTILFFSTIRLFFA